MPLSANDVSIIISVLMAATCWDALSPKCGLTAGAHALRAAWTRNHRAIRPRYTCVIKYTHISRMTPVDRPQFSTLSPRRRPVRRRKHARMCRYPFSHPPAKRPRDLRVCTHMGSFLLLFCLMGGSRFFPYWRYALHAVRYGRTFFGLNCGRSKDGEITRCAGKENQSM